MTDEQKLLFSLAAAAIHREEAMPTMVSVKWQGIYKLAKEQSVASVIFNKIKTANLKDGLSHELLFQWIALSMQIEKQNIRVNAVLYKLFLVLNRHGIPTVLLKGQGLAQEYEAPLSRTPGDIDIFVGAQNYERAKSAFDAEGWLKGSNSHEDFKHFNFTVDGISVELHYYCVILPDTRCNQYFQEWMERALIETKDGFYVDKYGKASSKKTNDSILIKMLPAIENTIYTFTHLFIHFVSGRIVLRQLMDFSVLVKKLMTQDEQAAIETAVEQHLKKAGLLIPWQTFCCLLVAHLGFKHIPCIDRKYDRKASRIANKLFVVPEKRYKIVDKQSIISSLCWYADVWGGYWKNFNIFPLECLTFLYRMLLSSMVKYINLAHGNMHRR